MVGSGVNTKDDKFAMFVLAEMSCRGVWRDTRMRLGRPMESVNVPVGWHCQRRWRTWLRRTKRARGVDRRLATARLQEILWGSIRWLRVYLVQRFCPMVEVILRTAVQPESAVKHRVRQLTLIARQGKLLGVRNRTSGNNMHSFNCTTKTERPSTA